jgi:putative holliday junction resolvase
MRYLGIDYGDKRVGVAISDESRQLAFPYKVIENVKDLVGKILEIIQKEEIGTVVVGESLDFQGQPNVVMKNIEKFVEELRTKTEANIFYEPEFLTSHQAQKKMSRRPRESRGSGSSIFMNQNRDIDASAAAIILQSFLDRGMSV